MFAYQDAQILDITGPLEVFARTTRWLRDHAGLAKSAYEVELVAIRRGPITTSGGLQLIATRSIREARRIDTLLVSGGIGQESAARNPVLLAWLRARAKDVERLGSICNGALILAHAGLLDNRTVTTHWAWCERLAAAAPRARVDADALYVCSGRLYTSAGVTAGMDLALALVEQDWGSPVALAVAQELVMFLKRPGGQSQFSRFLQAQQHDDEFGRLELWILQNLDEDLSVPALAARASMSARHFARRFAKRFGVTPAAYILRARVEAARRRIEEGPTRMKAIARQCGFADEQGMRRAFRRTLGVVPAEYRARFGN
jgi:transcriptional regulator GlxA family with amidase domain